jgi:hypothetical protein
MLHRECSNVAENLAYNYRPNFMKFMKKWVIILRKDNLSACTLSILLLSAFSPAVAPRHGKGISCSLLSKLSAIRHHRLPDRGKKLGRI